MFDKWKKLSKAQKSQSKIGNYLEQVQAVAERSGVKIVVNANHKVISVEVDGEEDRLMRDLINAAFKEAKKKGDKLLRSKVSELGLEDLL